MPAKYFVLLAKADKEITKLPLLIQNKIDRAFAVLQQNPLTGVKLSGELKGYYKYRLGDYRIVYSFDKKTSTVIIAKIEHRQGVYK